jgi:hypothetical protein
MTSPHTFSPWYFNTLSNKYLHRKEKERGNEVEAQDYALCGRPTPCWRCALHSNGSLFTPLPFVSLYIRLSYSIHMCFLFNNLSHSITPVLMSFSLSISLHFTHSTSAVLFKLFLLHNTHLYLLIYYLFLLSFQ